ncbi:MAG TPA: hypothetical protein VMW20_05695 [Candidatus Nanoarchaeia archaeon]|nr:hypothetical protein [Candidatus Nanoarchaeia archaeon]
MKQIETQDPEDRSTQAARKNGSSGSAGIPAASIWSSVSSGAVNLHCASSWPRPSSGGPSMPSLQQTRSCPRLR